MIDHDNNESFDSMRVAWRIQSALLLGHFPQKH